MEKRIFFDDARTNVLNFFTAEFPEMQLEQIDAFISVFYKLANYEEEGQKIRPTILISNNINAISKLIPHSKKIVFYEDKDLVEFKAHIKSLMCFCKYDWSLYINFGENAIEFGIINSLTSIKEKSLLQYVSQGEFLDSISSKHNFAILTVMGGGVCRLIGARNNWCDVHFNLSSQAEYNWDNEIVEFVDACVSKIKTTQKKLDDIKTLITNIFYRVLRDLHGAICVVVDKDFKDTTGFLQDGTWLKEPIEFGKLFLRSTAFDENVLRSYADILTTMLDYDGITIIDNAGRIRAYNIFIESSMGDTKIVGGARRRAAFSILQNKTKKIVGVYFQSQDGDNFYKQKSDLKKKSKIKIVKGEVVNQGDEIIPLAIVAQLQEIKQQENKKTTEPKQTTKNEEKTKPEQKNNIKNEN